MSNFDFIDFSLKWQEEFDISIYSLIMSFWSNVSYELEFQGISRKELSYLVDIKEMTIHKAIERDSIPNADTAIKIAKALNVSVEYLLDLSEDEKPANNESARQDKMTKIFQKYGSLISQLEKLSQKEKSAVIQLVETLAK